jgi:Uma2 family endonuclease
MSAMSDDRPITLTWEEYLKFDAISSERHELVRGEVRAMTGGSRRHDLLVQWINVALYQAFGSGEGPCEVFPHTRKLRTADATGFCPDVYVRCTPPGHDYFDDDARFVIEVLSPSNHPADRTERLYGYLSLPSVETILFVDHHKRVVTVHERVGGRWSEYQVGAGEVELGPATLDFTQLWARLDATAPLV